MSHFLTILLLAFWCVVFPAFAQSSSQGQLPIPGTLGGVIVWWICARRRRRPIGGWLLYFFINLFGNVIVTAVLAIVSINTLAPHSLTPSSWGDSRLYYALFLISTIPLYIFMVVLAVITVILLQTRAWKWVRVLRFALGIDICLGFVGLAVDAALFPDSTSFAVYNVVFPSVFLLYLIKSKRVKRVFQTKDWGVPEIPTFLDSEPE